jgi:uncharacterized damage-inducible protein DinB
MPDDASLREHLIQLLKGGHAHATFEDAVRKFPVEKAGIRPNGAPHSAWDLLEHIRIAQNDILRFSQSADYESPSWPDGYWPAAPAPAGEMEWHRSVRAFHKDLADFQAMVRDPARDLHARFPWGDGQTLLREALLIADHNAYHLGQLVLVRRLLGAWPVR